MEEIGDYLEQKIRFADRMLVKHAIDKIQVGKLRQGCGILGEEERKNSGLKLEAAKCRLGPLHMV